jgi:hypothetical protein
MEPDTSNEFKVKGEELLRKVKEIVHEGNARRIIVKDEKGETYLEIPLTLGVVGALFMPVLAALGARTRRSRRTHRRTRAPEDFPAVYRHDCGPGTGCQPRGVTDSTDRGVVNEGGHRCQR